MEGNLRLEHAKGPPFSINQRTTIQLPTRKNVPQEMETTPSSGRSTAQVGQFDGQRNTGVSGRVGNPTKNQRIHPWWWCGPHRSCTYGTNRTQRMIRTWRIRPTTDCKGGTAARKKRVNGQGMSQGMPGGNVRLQCCSHASSLPCVSHNSQDQPMLRLRANRTPEWTVGQTMPQ